MSNSIRIRASSLPSLLDCSMRWEAENIRGIRKHGNGFTQIGTAVHGSTAAFDQAKLDGSPITIDDASEVGVAIIEEPEEEVAWAGMARDTAIEATLRATVNYCADIAPHQNYSVVEHTLDGVEIDMGDGIIFSLTGTLDRIRQDEFGNKGVDDIKTGQRIIDSHGEVSVSKHLPQLGEYELLAEREFGPMTLPARIIGLQSAGDFQTGIAEITNARDALVGNEFNPGLLTFAASMFKTGMFPPNPSSILCSNTYCPIYNQCQYHG